MQFFSPFWYLSPAVARAISSPFLTTESRILPHNIPCGVCSGQIVTGKLLFPNTLVFHWHRHSINTPSAPNTDAVE